MLLLTGASGFIGGCLLQTLAESNTPVRCLVRKTVPRSLHPAAEQVRGDLVSGQGIEEALRGVDTVIHLAGVTKALRTADYYTGNARATETLARAVRGRSIAFVHVSSLAAAGPGANLSEDVEPRPVSQYGRSKLEAERLARDILPTAVIVRPPVVYGPGDTDVFQMLQAAAKGLTLEIAGGDRWFSAIFVKDLAAGLLAVAREPRAIGRTYNLAYPEPSTWREMTDAAARIMRRRPPRVLRVPYAAAFAVGAGAEAWYRFTGKPGIISRDKVREARYPFWTCDASRAADELGFRASTGLEAGLTETLAWYKEAGWLMY